MCVYINYVHYCNVVAVTALSVNNSFLQKRTENVRQRTKNYKKSRWSRKGSFNSLLSRVIFGDDIVAEIKKS